MIKFSQQLKNALSSILAAQLGIEIITKFAHQLNAHPPIWVILFGILIFSKFSHPLKAPFPIVVILSEMHHYQYLRYHQAYECSSIFHIERINLD